MLTEQERIFLLMMRGWDDRLNVLQSFIEDPPNSIRKVAQKNEIVPVIRNIVRQNFNDIWFENRLRHDKVILQHDNDRLHVAKVVKTYLEALKWEILPHPPYSPDVAPSDYHLFRLMAHGLVDQHFRSYEEVKNWIDLWIASKDDEFFRCGIRTLPERWEKVVASDGQYFES
ncbi:MOS1T transposase, partial [Pseudoatta argentina]